MARLKPNVGLNFGPTELDAAHARVYADASFPSYNAISLQLGFVFMLARETRHCHILDNSSTKAKRFVRSIKAGEVSAFVDVFHATRVVANDMFLMYCTCFLVVVPRLF